MTPADAEMRAARLLSSVELEPTGMEQKEAADDPRPKRMDRHYAWEAREGDARNVGEARYRLEAKVTGDRASGFGVKLRLPEAFERLRSRRTALTGIIVGLMILGGLGSFGVALRDAARAHMAGVIPWRRMLRVGPIALGFALIGAVNGWPRFVFNYQTTMAWSSYLVLFGVGIVTACVLVLLPRVGPERARAGTAAVGGFAGGRGCAGAHGARGAARARHRARGGEDARPRAPGDRRVVPTVRQPAGAGSRGLPRHALARARGDREHDRRDVPVWIRRGGRVAGSCPRASGRAGRSAGGCSRRSAVGVALSPVRGMGEALVALKMMALILIAAYALVRWVLRDNPLAYLAGIYGFFMYRGVGGLLEQPTAWARGQGIVALVVLLVPVVWVWMRGRGKLATG